MIQRFAIILVLTGAVLLSVCGSEGVFAAERESSGYVPASTAMAERTALPQLYDAVGTVKARTDIRVEAQVTGRVRKVLVRPGDSVKAGDELVVLDSRASQARLERSRQARDAAESMVGQARDQLAAAKAELSKAESTFRRMKQLHEQNVVTAEEMEKAESAFLQAQARYGQARAGLAAARSRRAEAEKVTNEAEIGLGYTTITAQEDGEIARRLVEPGDLAFPSKELLTLQTGASLRLEAMVRESLIGTVRIGDELTVVVSAIGSDERIVGVVDEIEPLADPVTRSFMVKARLPEVPGLYPGMFGRLRIPRGERETVLIPAEAVTRVGQLETVMVKTDQGWEAIFVRTGTEQGGRVEVLSGLSGGETVGIGVQTGDES